MRLGLVAPAGHERRWAAEAERAGLFGVLVGGAPGAETIVAAEAATATSLTRLLVTLHLGHDNPVTLAEEVAVLDLISGGRVVVVVAPDSLAPDDADEELALLRAAWSGRAVQHDGSRWHVPAGLDGHVAPASVMVTPKPAQVDMPVWVAPSWAGSGQVRVVVEPADVDAAAAVAPGLAALTGDLDTDRQTVLAWAAAGATHLLCRLPHGDKATEALALIARWLAPEVGMVAFPRVIAAAPLPLESPRYKRT